MPRSTRPSARDRIHSCPEVSHPRLGLSLIACRHGAGVLLEDVQQDQQVPGPLVDHAITSPREPNSQLPQLSLDLRRRRELRRWVAWVTAVQVLLDRVVNLRDRERLGTSGTQQLLEKDIDGLLSSLVSIEDGLHTSARRHAADTRPRTR
jgi:hypothetical protein